MESHHTSQGRAFDVAVMHAWGAPPAGTCPIPAGHRVTRARLRHLVGSERLVVTWQGSCLGVAAYQVVESHVRVVHDFLVDHRLSPARAVAVIDTMLAGLEFAARDERVTCLVVLVDGDVPLDPFTRREYTALLADAVGAWLQKKLEPFDRLQSSSHRVH